jgi:hypothetical protein
MASDVQLRDAIAKTIEQVAEAQDIHVWSLFPYADAVLALPEMVDLLREARIGRLALAIPDDEAVRDA